MSYPHRIEDKIRWGRRNVLCRHDRCGEPFSFMALHQFVILSGAKDLAKYLRLIDRCETRCFVPQHGK